MTLDRKDYKSAIPQLEKRISQIEQVGEKGLANFDVLKASLEKEIRVRTQALLKTNERVEYAITSADGKNTIYHSASAPTGGEYKVGDTWFDASNGYAIHTWNGSSWVKEELGEDAIANLAITNAKIAEGTIQNAKIGTLDAGKITSGDIASARLQTNVVSAINATVNQIDAKNIKTSQITIGESQVTNLSTDLSNRPTTSTVNSAIATAKADAEKVATNYLTTISGTTGISVHSANDTSNFANINSSGMTVYKGGTSESNKVAIFGDTATIGKTSSINTVVDSSGMAIKDNGTNLATFKSRIVGSWSSDSGTTIEASNAIGIYPNSSYSANKGFTMKYASAGDVIFNFNNRLQFTPQPTIVAKSNNANISLTANSVKKVPLTYIDVEQSNSLDGNIKLMDIDAGSVVFNELDGISVEVTASVYVLPTASTPAHVFLYYYNGSDGTTTEIGAGATYLTTFGGAVQLCSRVISPIFGGDNDKLYISVRCASATGTAYCKHKDTFLTVKYV